jgi:hypothetical protein
MEVPTNPFAILRFISAPAVLTNASCVLLFGTGNRYVDLPNTGLGYAVHVPLGAITWADSRWRSPERPRPRGGVISLPRSPIRYRNKLVLSLPFANER